MELYTGSIKNKRLKVDSRKSDSLYSEKELFDVVLGAETDFLVTSLYCLGKELLIMYNYDTFHMIWENIIDPKSYSKEVMMRRRWLFPNSQPTSRSKSGMIRLDDMSIRAFNGLPYNAKVSDLEMEVHIGHLSNRLFIAKSRAALDYLVELRSQPRDVMVQSTVNNSES